MRTDLAYDLLTLEKSRVEGLLRDIEQSIQQERVAQSEEISNSGSSGALNAQATSVSLKLTLAARLTVIERAEQRLSAGTYGRSVRSGLRIPDERLWADPAAELTVEEAELHPG